MALFHKSEILAEIKDLEKFTSSGSIKPRISVFNKQLKAEIDAEMAAIHTAYRTLCETVKSDRITSEMFEEGIDKVLHPQKYSIHGGEEKMLDRLDVFDP